jgi:septal ring factor EnvC (AmiA/AmiB activator)
MEETTEQTKSKASGVLIVIIIISLALAGAIFFFFQKERTAKLAVETQLQTVTSKYEQTRKALAESDSQLGTLKTRLGETEARIVSLNSELQSEKAAKKEAMTLLNQMKADLEQQNSLKAVLEKQLADYQQTLKAMETQLQEAETQKAALENKVKGYEEKFGGVELGKIVVNSENQPAKKSPAVKLEGRVLVVNKDYNFAVINLGNKDGVVPGSTFGVFHNNKEIGTLRVEKVHDAMSAAGFASLEMKDKVFEGDRVESKN